MMKTVIGCGILAAGLAIGAAAAQDGPPRGPGMMWRQLDANGDGQVTMAEMSEHQRAMFAEADSDGNGAISKDEMQAFMKKRHAEMRAKRLGDSNDDGAVTRAEYDAKAKARFDELDANKDGVISEDEMQAMHKGRHHGWRGGR